MIKKKLIKGSKAAKDFMAKIRAKRTTAKIGASGDYAKYEIAVIKKLASLLKKPYKQVIETVNLDQSLLNIISKNFDKKVSVLNCAKELKIKLIAVAKKNPIEAFVEILSKLPKNETKEIKPKFPMKLPATVTIGANKKTSSHKDVKSHNVKISVMSGVNDLQKLRDITENKITQTILRINELNFEIKNGFYTGQYLKDAKLVNAQNKIHLKYLKFTLKKLNDQILRGIK